MNKSRSYIYVSLGFEGHVIPVTGNRGIVFEKNIDALVLARGVASRKTIPPPGLALFPSREIKRDALFPQRGGFPGGMGMPGNMNNLMKQAQKMQKQMEEATKELEEKEITATAGGGAVEVTMTGKKEITKVKLAEEVVDPDDIEMLEDLIMAAANEASRQIEETSQQSMSRITGGLGGINGLL